MANKQLPGVRHELGALLKSAKKVQTPVLTEPVSTKKGPVVRVVEKPERHLRAVDKIVFNQDKVSHFCLHTDSLLGALVRRRLFEVRRGKHGCDPASCQSALDFHRRSRLQRPSTDSSAVESSLESAQAESGTSALRNQDSEEQ
jgi:hypothetical protein